MEAVLEHLLRSDPGAPAIADVEAWWRQHSEASAAFALPIERTMAGAFVADRVGYAFASGYQEALAQMFPDRERVRRALCATEAGGAHPRDIATRLEPAAAGWRLTGHKTWATLATHVDELVVVANEGQDDEGRHRLTAVCVPATRAGISFAPMPATPFVPEIPHAQVHLEQVQVEPNERLSGDGYAAILKPFRTIEDCHVLAAVTAWLLGVGRRLQWPQPQLERLVLGLVGAHRLAVSDPADPAVQIGLAGLLQATHETIARLEPLWETADAGLRDLWRRDRALLDVASKVRERRRVVAWARFHSA